MSRISHGWTITASILLISMAVLPGRAQPYLPEMANDRSNPAPSGNVQLKLVPASASSNLAEYPPPAGPGPKLSGAFGPVPAPPDANSHADTGTLSPADLGSVAACPAPPVGRCVQPTRSRWEIWNDRIHDCWLGYDEEFEARPLGQSLYAFGNNLVANGDAARMVLYHFDFVEGSDQLNPRGHEQLAVIACLLAKTSFPLIIERTPWAPGLDDARRVVVLNELGRNGVPVPVERVVIGPPIARGLYGREIEFIYNNLMIQTQSGGTQAGAGGGSIGGTVGAGFNAQGR